MKKTHHSKRIFMFSLISLIGLQNAFPNASDIVQPSRKRFKRPIMEISGWWQVVRHEADMNRSLPTDWPSIYKHNKAYLPIGKIIHIQPTGLSTMILKGPDGMPNGPSGEGFIYTIFPPFGDDYCAIREEGQGWKKFCELYRERGMPAQQRMIILDIDFNDRLARRWPKVEPYLFDIAPEAIMPTALDSISISRDKKELYLMLLRPENRPRNGEKEYESFEYATVLRKIPAPSGITLPKSD
ncbi:hypothetical protein [Acidovorax sp. PRC11]|uniref:hypothetical protein n=1 Tax=Acidovorax sp. PRC11 TaxID=2962592 RepID=UPI002882B30E|nr:hypothetical protein [Acidovorax sp. PRC11]MDT0140227.1 hypothetical protein [Acidovorax sp. PRC11]